jgi:manganese-dependent inorganic pyrophosphatase
MYNDKKTIIVIGHKNPDTDSICSAICYADLKSKITNETYVAKRAGHLNEETQYVLKKYNIPVPEYIKDVRPQVSDIDIRRTEGVSKDISVKDAWTKMKELNVVTLPITCKKRLIGLITIGDIAKSYFEVYDSTILSTAKTRFQNIVDTLNGTVITGDINEVFTKGKVVIAAANPDMMENYIEEGDIVILGNRYEAQLCAIEMEAKCIIVCEGAGISKTITKVANERDCIIISTSYDTYTVARLINQSMPIEFLMRKKEDGVISFNTDDFIEDIQGIMVKKRHRDFPIEDNKNNYIGMISRRNLLSAGKKQIILVDHNERGQAISGVETAQILEIIDHHRIGSIETVTPVFFRNQPLGCTATIIYQMYHENNIAIPEKIAYLLCSAIISDTLIFKSPTCTEEDIKACHELADIAGINIVEHGMEMFNAGSNLSSKTAKEIIMQDYKKFSVNDVTIGVGQINTMSQTEIDNIRGRIENYIDRVVNDGNVDMVFLLMTNIMTESSEVVFAGKSAGSVLANAFNVTVNGKTAILEKIVSRKKQFFPAIMETLQQ